MPKWLDNAVFYQIYPQSFQDTNADGIGDFEGIRMRLPYIKELGCNAIWLNPCFDSPFMDAGYDIRDYYKTASRYGTNADLKRLFDEAHRLSMHVILDLVPGHTSLDAEWFKQSCKPEKNAYTGRYIWSDSVWESMENIENIAGVLRGICDRNASVATNFFSTQPALNYGFAKVDKPWQMPYDSEDAMATRHAMMDVMRFWLKMGCDGFRVDMAGSLIKADKDQQQTIRLWQDVRAFLDREFPDAAIISEWGMPDRALKAGFHMDFLLAWGDSQYTELFRTDTPYFSGTSDRTAKAFVKRYEEYRQSTNGKGLICIPSGNHDTARIRKFLSEEEMHLAFCFLLTMPGAPFIYYGDEIGMRYVEGLTSREGAYERTGTRTPMQWDDGLNSGFSTAKAEELYLPLDPDPYRPNVASSMTDKNSLWHTVHTLLTLRQKEAALQTNGCLTFLSTENGALVYDRSADGKRFIVAINPKGHAALCQVDIPEEAKLAFYAGEMVSITKYSITIPACSAVILSC